MIDASARQFPEPEPIRRSDLPSIPSSESEIFTWFPHPDGGDMVRGQRQRGVQIRRRVTYSDWEPVRPDHWADESEGPGVHAAAEGSTESPLPALLTRLITDGAHHVYAAAHSKAEELARVHEGFAAGFHTAAVYVADLISTGHVRAGQPVRAEDEAAARRAVDGLSVDPAGRAQAISDAIYGATVAAMPQKHIGGNAEDCPGCHGTNPPYPFICLGSPGDA
ncbi:hypothetical protein ACFWMG_04980 [Streptomyces sp. NPDC127074]|uniref:hypothetical protein n=1 Tax=Streptomyces sp. NPDC127074 TaxID=3347130 RepID=UPI003659181F